MDQASLFPLPAPEPYPVAQYKHLRMHTVNAAGGAADGSLYLFHTMCGRVVNDIDQWTEHDGAQATCKVCLRVLRCHQGHDPRAAVTLGQTTLPLAEATSETR